MNNQAFKICVLLTGYKPLADPKHKPSSDGCGSMGIKVTWNFILGPGDGGLGIPLYMSYKNIVMCVKHGF